MVSDDSNNKCFEQSIMSIEDIKQSMIKKYKTNYSKLKANIEFNESLNTNFETKIKLISKITPLFNRYKFTDQKSPFYIDDNQKHKTTIYFRITYYYSNRLYPNNLVKEKINEHYLNLDKIQMFIDDFSLLEHDIDETIQNSNFFNNKQFKLYLIYMLYCNQINSLNNKIIDNTEDINKNKYEIARIRKSNKTI